MNYKDQEFLKLLQANLFDFPQDLSEEEQVYAIDFLYFSCEKDQQRVKKLKGQFQRFQEIGNQFSRLFNTQLRDQRGNLQGFQMLSKRESHKFINGLNCSKISEGKADQFQDSERMNNQSETCSFE